MSTGLFKKAHYQWSKIVSFIMSKIMCVEVRARVELAYMLLQSIVSPLHQRTVEAGKGF